MSATTLRSLRLAVASLLAVALVAQLAIGMSRGDLTVVRYLSNFSILANAAAVVLLTMLAARPGRDSSPTFALFRGATTVYMTVTALVYAVILAPSTLDVGLTEPWVDWSLHVVGPMALLVDWVMNRPEAKLPRSAPLTWMVFPAAYLGYILGRGEIVGWYPYPTLDPDRSGGYGGVAVRSLAVLVIILGLAYAYAWWAGREQAEPVTD